MNLIERLERDFGCMEIHPDAKAKYLPYLLALRNKDEETLEHSVRVAYIAKGIAEFTHIVPSKALWLPGLVHDVGKGLVPYEILTKKVGFDEGDMKEMKKHVEYGCRMLLGVADFSALSLFYHHFFKSADPYPSQEDYKRIFGNHFDKWTEGSRTLAKYCGRLVALADFYDALTQRENDKYSPGKAKLPDAKESREILTAENKDQDYLIGKLYEEKIFGGGKNE